MHTNKGFTLTEMLIAVVIAGVLAAVALPAYTSYVTRAKIPDATTGLATKAIQLEQYFQDNRTYVSAPACSSDTTSSKYFTFSCTSSSASAFALQAVGRSSMAGFTFTVDQTNAKTTSAVPSGWTQPSPNNCWVTNKGGVC